LGNSLVGFISVCVETRTADGPSAAAAIVVASISRFARRATVIGATFLNIRRE
jgi:hypothetical protein